MKKLFKLSRLFSNDFVMRIISVLAAIIVWLVIMLGVYTGITDVVSLIPVNLDLTNTTPEAYNLSVIDGLNQTVSVTVSGNRDKVLQLTKDDFITSPVLTQVNKAGEYQIRVDIKKVNERDLDYQIVSNSPLIKVRFDQIIDQEFPIQANAESVVADDGYIREQPFVNPEKIMLHGPSSEISKIARCVVQTDETIVSDQTLVLDGYLVFYDEMGNKLSFKYTTYEQNDYEITIPINKLKTVPITFKYVNVPQGIDAAKLNYKLSETEIKLAGPSKTIDEINEISLGEIDFRMIDIGYAPEFDINVLAGVVNVDNIKSVVVDFSENVLSSESFTIPEKNIIIRNAPTSYNVKLDTKSINGVKMVGIKDDIDKIVANDLIAYVDFSSKEITEGSSRQTLQIYVTGNKLAWAVGEYRAVVNITKKSS